jgi:hypothetical protein
MQYLFATPKVILGLKFDSLPIFLKGHPQNKWWEKLYDDFKFDTCVVCLDRGDEIESATAGIRYEQLREDYGCSYQGRHWQGHLMHFLWLGETGSKAGNNTLIFSQTTVISCCAHTLQWLYC